MDTICPLCQIGSMPCTDTALMCVFPNKGTELQSMAPNGITNTIILLCTGCHSFSIMQFGVKKKVYAQKQC